MTIRHLKIFITVVDCGKMSRAAEELYITQPTVSQAIRELEDYYGVRLFERLSRQLYITEEGRTLLSYARYIVDSFEDMELTMKNRGSSGRLRIGASVSVGTCLLGKKLSLLEAQIPEIETEITVCNTSVIEEMVLKSNLDVGLVEGAVDSGDIVRLPIYEDELVIVVGKPHPLYGRDDLELSCLNGQNYISRETGSAEKNQLEQMLNLNDLHLKRIWNCTNTEAIKNAVMEGRGFAILSRMIVEKEAAEGSLQIILEENSLKRDIHLIYHKDKYLSDSLKTWIDICRNQNAR